MCKCTTKKKKVQETIKNFVIMTLVSLKYACSLHHTSYFLKLCVLSSCCDHRRPLTDILLAVLHSSWCSFSIQRLCALITQDVLNKELYSAECKYLSSEYKQQIYGQRNTHENYKNDAFIEILYKIRIIFAYIQSYTTL